MALRRTRRVLCIAAVFGALFSLGPLTRAQQSPQASGKSATPAPANSQSACPIAGATSPLGTLSYYASRDNYAYVDTMWEPQKRVTAMLGYGGSVVRGSATFLNPLTPTGTLDYTYLKPFVRFVSVAFDLYKGLSYNTRA